MRVTSYDRIVAYLALVSGLAISAVAIYYSVAGLVSIFAAAAVPIAIMGIALEAGKLIATVWLKQNWFIAPKIIRAYLFVAVMILMAITSMGIFGYLSKAHLDQAVPTGDIVDKVALIDERIKTQKDNIDVARKALVQLDASVDQVMARSTSEQGAARASQIRKAQAKERTSLQNDIAVAQQEIAKLNDERAPIAKELRKVEAEVGPIKYIAALIYGEGADQNMLEAAVRWVIILIVVIFDPLAIVLLLASQYSFQYFKKLEHDEPITFEEAGRKPEPEPAPEPEVVAASPLPTSELRDDPVSLFPAPTTPIVEEERPYKTEEEQREIARMAFDAVFRDWLQYFKPKETPQPEGETNELKETADQEASVPQEARGGCEETDQEDTKAAGEAEETVEVKKIVPTVDSTLRIDEVNGIIHDISVDLQEGEQDATDPLNIDDPVKEIEEGYHNLKKKQNHGQEEVTYVQNSEQNSSSVWSRIKSS